MHMLQGVEGVLIAGNDGQIHKTTLSEQMTQEYASQIPSLAALARNVVRDLDTQVSNVVLSCAGSNTWVSSSMLDWQEQ
mgnify:CR=1 FL=1